MLSDYLAERAGFEPAIPLRVCRISSAVLSTTQPPLRGRLTYRYGPENASHSYRRYRAIDRSSRLVARARASLRTCRSRADKVKNMGAAECLYQHCHSQYTRQDFTANEPSCGDVDCLSWPYPRRHRRVARLRTQGLRAGRLADQGVWSAPTQ